MESPEQSPETLSGEQASEELDEDRGPFEREAERATEQTDEGSSDFGGESVEGDIDNLSDTSETEMTGSAEPGTTATPEGTPEVSE